MRQPQFTQAGLSIVQKHMVSKNKLRSLETAEETPVMSSNCPTLDWITDVGGIPRGRVVQISGPESSGKCVILDTVVPVHGRGLVTVRDLLAPLSWREERGQVAPDQVCGLEATVVASNCEPVATTGAYFAGVAPTQRLVTGDGRELVGVLGHRVLTLPPTGVLRWTTLRDVRLGQVVVGVIGQRVAGDQAVVGGWELPVGDRVEVQAPAAAAAALLGALAGAEVRDGVWYLLVTGPYQIKQVQRWAQRVVGDPAADPFDPTVSTFSRFCGLARIRDGVWTEIAVAARTTVAGLLRQAGLAAQVHWCAGLTLVRGTWTQGDFEVELESATTAQTLHLLMENLGIRVIYYPSLNTFGEHRFKIALRDYLAQQAAQQVLWEGYHLPPDWRAWYVPEQSETHEYVQATLVRAREIFKSVGQDQLASDIDLGDWDKDQLLSVAQKLEPFSRPVRAARVFETLCLLGAPGTILDSVTLVKAAAAEPAADLTVPIGNHYTTNGLVSHNSTTAMHLANVELARNPQAIVVFQDYEHSMSEKYARKMGLHRHQGRFHLVPSDLFEEADDYVKLYMSNNVWPSLWILDSVPAMVPKAAFERETDENPQVALQARLFADLLGRWVKVAADYGTTFLFLNQTRAHIPMGWGDKGRSIVGIPGSEKETPPGGSALRFYTSMWIDLRPSKVVKAKVFNPMLGDHEEIPIANVVKATVRKNKCGSPYRSGVFYVQYGEGIDVTRTIFDLALTQGLITTAGQAFEVSLTDGQVLAVRGQEAFINALKGKTHGNLGPVALQALQQSLQWHRADEIHAQVLGLTTENQETGEVTDDAVEGVVLEGQLQYVRSQGSLVAKADALDLLTRRSKSIYWTNTASGQEFRSMSLEALEKKLDAADRQVLREQVEAKLAVWEERIAAQRALGGATGLPGPGGGEGVAAPPPVEAGVSGGVGELDPIAAAFGNGEVVAGGSEGQVTVETEGLEHGTE